MKNSDVENVFDVKLIVHVLNNSTTLCLILKNYRYFRNWANYLNVCQRMIIIYQIKYVIRKEQLNQGVKMQLQIIALVNLVDGLFILQKLVELNHT